MDQAVPSADLSAYDRRLLVLFGLVYFAQGIGQHVGLVAQPLQFFFKEALGLNPAQTTEYLAVLTIPWTIKPLYGLVSDFIPLLGYRRKSWLLLTNLIAAVGFLWLTGLTNPGAVVAALMLTALGTAAADVIIDAVMVENGRRTGLTAQFQSMQWLWINVASVFSALLGGYLCSVLQPGTVLHVAALISLVAPLTVTMASWLIVREEKSSIALAEMKATTAGLLQSFRAKTLWTVIGFIAFWNFSPSFGTPWYYHMTDTLKFSQYFIGVLGAFASIGGVIGAFAYWRTFAKRPLRQQLSFGIWAGTVGTLLFLLLLRPSGLSHALAILINLAVGMAGMIALLATLTLAAQACPERSEGFTFAALMSVNNAATQISAIVGARLYTDVFKSMLPLIVVSAATTFASFLLLPTLERAQEGSRAGKS